MKNCHTKCLVILYNEKEENYIHIANVFINIEIIYIHIFKDGKEFRKT